MVKGEHPMLIGITKTNDKLLMQSATLCWKNTLEHSLFSRGLTYMLLLCAIPVFFFKVTTINYHRLVTLSMEMYFFGFWQLEVQTEGMSRLYLS